MLKFELTGGGYRVYGNDGQPWLDVLGDPELPAVEGLLQPFASEAAARAHAEATISALEPAPEEAQP